MIHREVGENKHEHLHVGIECITRRIEKNLSLRIAGVVDRRNDIGKERVLNTTERVSTCYEGYHLGLVEALTCEVGSMGIKGILWLRYTRVVCRSSIHTTTSEVDLRAPAGVSTSETCV